MSPHTKVALVTGAGTGIGKAVALAFLRAGYRVTLTGRRKELLEQAVREDHRGVRTPRCAVQQCRGQCARHRTRRSQL